MATSIGDIAKTRGRPKTTGLGLGVLVRLQPGQLQALDVWISKHDEPLTRPEALRAMLAIVLSMKAKGRQSSDKQKTRAREMAGKAIDRMSDRAAPADDQAGRKSRLLKGPEEFRDSRVDRKPKK